MSNTGAGSGYGFDEGPKAQSGTFKRLQQMTDSGQGGIYLSFITYFTAIKKLYCIIVERRVDKYRRTLPNTFLYSESTYFCHNIILHIIT